MIFYHRDDSVNDNTGSVNLGAVCRGSLVRSSHSFHFIDLPLPVLLTFLSHPYLPFILFASFNSFQYHYSHVPILPFISSANLIFLPAWLTLLSSPFPNFSFFCLLFTAQQSLGIIPGDAHR
jgi:hypothetical protein